MGLEICYIVVGLLMLVAVFDLIVGVTNDAVNFLNSSIGSKAAPFFIVMTIASVGILSGVTFSGSMMEVARKGIFHPQFFTMPELLILFLAVMITDILLLDLFNTHGLPTSTTVSIVFELLGAAVALSMIKILSTPDTSRALWDYINTAKAMAIAGGILMSIVIAFFSGALTQFLTRIIFTFDYKDRLKRYGALWGGVAMTVITFFILIKGAKGATFMDDQTVLLIKTNSFVIMAAIFIVSAILLQILISFFKINIFKIIVLVGTFALAMAFAANDLVNFIGVPLAGLSAFQNALAMPDPLTASMEALNQQVKSKTWMLLLAGLIMVITLWISKKARTVTETEIRLGQQDEGTEKFESIWISRKIVNLFDSMFSTIKSITPESIKKEISKRLTPFTETTKKSQKEKPAFDLVRASVNLMVASAVVSFATSLKLPLSTTYVTFMVAMGSSFSDQAWGRESAVYRVTGVLTVIGGWFMTAFIAFVVSFIFAYVLASFELTGFFALAVFTGFMVWKNHRTHRKQEKNKEDIKIYNLHIVENSEESISETFDHLAYLLKNIRESFDIAFDALFQGDLYVLRNQRMHTAHIQKCTNIIVANIFKVLRLLSKEDEKASYNYYQIIRRLQKISDGFRDTIIRSSMHVSNRHKGLLDIQIQELKEIKTIFLNIIFLVETAFKNKKIVDCQKAEGKFIYLRELVDRFNENQIKRIRDDSSKTRLSILFYAISGNCVMMAKQNVKLLEIFNESFKFKNNGSC
ncbi:MAG: inorganic phosphate transporter [Thermodesulfobacteriota bacterium]|nr:inorganic phosphate transporter [Thermodesulfobacteriota bacterium]